ncbi:uncharacterized protein C8R40DRAFT_1097973 [Lentinula edodes]|uniref:uncharacterized protein n=1 Tax=Lentinula edodes TaxID=5353 RepID=UPI001E8EA3FB|nr:uncharacterized protein C8R40DRAFT_1097973 [Lentinula edodes]KAH7876630.1 hypothetical protein C8R40DRAFT_1097973 [Lentinula edodes]
MFSSLRFLSALLVVMSSSTSFIFASPVYLAMRSSETTLTQNFTLAALNVTLPNVNLTGAPLVLGTAGAIDGESFDVTSTYASYPYNDFPSLALVDGNLRAFSRQGSWHTNASVPLLHGSLDWTTSSLYSSAASTAFTAESGTGNFSVLAFNGTANLWYLCPSDAPGLPQNSVYYNTTTIPSQSGASGASPVQCYSVTLNIIPV